MPTYIAFAADGNVDMYQSDIKYYRLLQAWDAMKGKDFEFINAHEKSAAIRSGSKEETIKRTLRDRLNKSKRMLLLVGDTTRLDDDFVPYEIEYAADSCKIPIIVCYVNHRKKITSDTNVKDLKIYLPKALINRMDNETVKTIHIPFRQRIISRAMDDYNSGSQPTYSFSFYTNIVYDSIYKPGEI